MYRYNNPQYIELTSNLRNRYPSIEELLIYIDSINCNNIIENLSYLKDEHYYESVLYVMSRYVKMNNIE